MGQNRPFIAEYDPPKPTGRPRIDPSAALNAIIYHLCSGVQWNHLPREFPDDSSVHRVMQRWLELNLFERIWALLVAECDEPGGINWHQRGRSGHR